MINFKSIVFAANQGQTALFYDGNVTENPTGTKKTCEKGARGGCLELRGGESLKTTSRQDEKARVTRLCIRNPNRHFVLMLL